MTDGIIQENKTYKLWMADKITKMQQLWRFCLNFGNSLCPDAMILFSLKSIKMHENVQRWKWMFTHYRHELGGIAICFFFFFWRGSYMGIWDVQDHHWTFIKAKKKKKKTPILTRSRKREKRNLKEIHWCELSAQEMRIKRISSRV